MKKIHIIGIIGIIILTIALGWMAIKCAYGIGYKNGTIDATQETSDELLVACEAKIDEMEADYNKKILMHKQEAYEQGRNDVLEAF